MLPAQLLQQLLWQHPSGLILEMPQKYFLLEEELLLGKQVKFYFPISDIPIAVSSLRRATSHWVTLNTTTWFRLAAPAAQFWPRNHCYKSFSCEKKTQTISCIVNCTSLVRYTFCLREFLSRTCEHNLTRARPPKNWFFVKRVFRESYRMVGMKKPYSYPVTQKRWERPGTNIQPGMNRGQELCVIQKTCFALGRHDVREPGFIFQSSCRCLQPILTPSICESGTDMRATVGVIDPGFEHNSRKSQSTLLIFLHLTDTCCLFFRSHLPLWQNS
jgi:hypothetical protein